jgi:hypothetical protein
VEIETGLRVMVSSPRRVGQRHDKVSLRLPAESAVAFPRGTSE